MYEAIYRIVRAIPRGRVATYGQVAALAGIPGHARQVGYALHALPEASDVPWHRVVNREGGISLEAQSLAAALQRSLLRSEGVRFSAGGPIALARFQWRPESPYADPSVSSRRNLSHNGSRKPTRRQGGSPAPPRRRRPCPRAR